MHEEYPTKPAQLVEAYQSAAEDEKGAMGVGAALVAESQATEAVEPRQGALDNPAIPAQPVPVLDAAPGVRCAASISAAFVTAPG